MIHFCGSRCWCDRGGCWLRLLLGLYRRHNPHGFRNCDPQICVLLGLQFARVVWIYHRSWSHLLQGIFHQNTPLNATYHCTSFWLKLAEHHHQQKPFTHCEEMKSNSKDTNLSNKASKAAWHRHCGALPGLAGGLCHNRSPGLAACAPLSFLLVRPGHVYTFIRLQTVWQRAAQRSTTPCSYTSSTDFWSYAQMLTKHRASAYAVHLNCQGVKPFPWDEADCYGFKLL